MVVEVVQGLVAVVVEVVALGRCRAVLMLALNMRGRAGTH